MKFCTHCGKEIMDEAVICPGCGCSVQMENSKQENDVDQSVSMGLVIWALLFPPFGFIYFFVSLKTRPICAVACVAAAFASWYMGIFSFVLGCIAGILEYQWV